MDFDELMIELSSSRLEYISLLYANSLLISHFQNSEYDECLNKNGFIIRVDEKSSESEFSLTSGFIKNEINNFLLKSLAYLPKTFEERENARKLSLDIYSSMPEDRYQTDLFKSTSHGLYQRNAHFLRTRVLNRFYESIKNWFTKNCPQEWSVLHTESWVQTLYLLRNIVSHEGGGDISKIKTLKRNKNNKKWLLESYPDTVKWENITIEDNQLENTVRYNDKEIMDLLKAGIDYLEENFRKYKK